MDAGVILFKTDQGRREIARRSGRLTAVQRRLLILVDGRKTVNDLAAFTRVGELDTALEHLLVLGLVAAGGEIAALAPPAAPGFACSQPPQPARPATSPREFARVRAQVSQFVRERLGDAGAPICAAVDRCSNPQQLRSMLRGIETFVGDRLDARTTQAFARHFGSLLL